jgi:hypothetical protein
MKFSIFRRQVLNKLVLSLFFTAVLSGCFDKAKESLFEDKAAKFVGTYDNQYNQDKLVFANKMVEIQSNGQVLRVPFTIEGESSLSIEVRNSSKEKRPDIKMRIHGGGELLTCIACAKYHLSNIWVKIGAEPK